MSEFEFLPAWGLKDPKIEHDAKEFWRDLKVLTAMEIERRASELIAAAYSGDRLVAVSTANFGPVEHLRARFAMYRCAVAPEYRRHHLSYQISGFSVGVLEKWALANPHEQIMGVAAIIQANQYKSGKQREPMWPEYDLNLNFVGYTNRGEQIRVAWFKHALLPE